MAFVTPGFTEPPKKADGSYDKDKIRELYMASPFIEWLEFCRSVNWNGRTMRQAISFKGWKKTKLARIAKEKQDAYDSANQNHELNLRTRRLKVTTDYPEMYEEQRITIHRLIRLINNDIYQATQNKKHTPKYGLKDLERAQRLLNNNARGHFAVLHVSDENLKMAKEPIKALQASNEKKGVEAGFTFKLAPGQTASVESIAEELGKWFDKPMDNQVQLINPMPEVIDATFKEDDTHDGD